MGRENRGEEKKNYVGKQKEGGDGERMMGHKRRTLGKTERESLGG